MSTQPWYKNPDLLRAAYDEYGSWDAVEREIGGGDATTFAKHYNKFGLTPLTRGPKAKPVKNEEALKRLAERVYA